MEKIFLYKKYQNIIDLFISNYDELKIKKFLEKFINYTFYKNGIF